MPPCGQRRGRAGRRWGAARSSAALAGRALPKRGCTAAEPAGLRPWERALGRGGTVRHVCLGDGSAMPAGPSPQTPCPKPPGWRSATRKCCPARQGARAGWVRVAATVSPAPCWQPPGPPPPLLPGQPRQGRPPAPSHAAPAAMAAGGGMGSAVGEGALELARQRGSPVQRTWRIRFTAGDRKFQFPAIVE